MLFTCFWPFHKSPSICEIFDVAWKDPSMAAGNPTDRASTVNVLGIVKEVIDGDLLVPFIKKFQDLPPYDHKSDRVEIITDDDHFCDILNQLHQKVSCPEEGAVYPLDIQNELFQTVCDHVGAFQAFSRLIETCLRSELLYQDSSPSIPVLVTRILYDGCNSNADFARRLCEEHTLLDTIMWTVNKLHDKHMKSKLSRTTEIILLQCLTIVYKCSRDECNFQTLRKAKVLDLSQHYFDSPSKDIQRTAILCAVYLAEEKDAKIFKSPKTCRIELVAETLRSALDTDTKMYEGWRASELLKGIGRFALCDCNKKPVIDCGVVDLAIKAMQVQDMPDVLIEATTALWTLSFDPLLKPAIRRDKTVLEILKTIISGRQDNPCYKPARGLMWSIRECLERRMSESGGALPVHISYHWSDREAVATVCTALKSWADCKISIDDVNEDGPSIDDMRTAVDQSLVVFLCLSRRFKNSLNCRTEAELAYSRRKELVPILISPKYKPDGWLGNMIGEKRIYDVTDEKCFDHRVREIIKILESKGM